VRIQNDLTGFWEGNPTVHAMSDETLISGRVMWAGRSDGVPGAIVSIYTLVPAGLVGRAEADEQGEYWVRSKRHWASAFDLYVVILNRRGELLQVVAEGPLALSGERTRLDVTVTGRSRGSGPRRAVTPQPAAEREAAIPHALEPAAGHGDGARAARSPASTPVPPTKCVVPTSFWPSQDGGQPRPPLFVGGGRGIRRHVSYRSGPAGNG
jgi:hypothetical protein